MHCEQIKTLLTDYLDGSIDQAMRQLIDSHLQNCAGCQRELNALRILWSELPQLPPVDPPAFLHERIMSRVEAQQTRQTQSQRAGFWDWLRGYRQAFAGAGVMAVLLLTLFAVNPGDMVGSGLFPGIEKRDEKPIEKLGQPVTLVWEGVQVNWEEGFPALVVGTRQAVEAKLEWSQDGKAFQTIWKGTLKPNQQFEMPLGWLQQIPGSKVNAHVLRWTQGSQTKVLFVPTGFSASEIADLRLRDTFTNALKVIAAQYQQTIIWETNSLSENPYVVLDARNATCEAAIEKLIQGAFQLTKRDGHWVITKL